MSKKPRIYRPFMSFVIKHFKTLGSFYRKAAISHPTGAKYVNKPQHMTFEFIFELSELTGEKPAIIAQYIINDINKQKKQEDKK